MRMQHTVVGFAQGMSTSAHLNSSLHICRAGSTRKVNVENQIVVCKPGVQEVLDGGCLGCARLSHKQAGAACSQGGAQEPS